MKKIFLLILFFPLLCIGQDQPALRFIRLLNEYKTDSLSSMLSENFILKRTFSDHSNDKTSFLAEYVPHSKMCNAKFIVVKNLSFDNPVKFLAEDKSDYLVYLDIKPMQWKISIGVQGDKIESFIIDTVGISKKYFEAVRFRTKQFENWLNKEYPGEINEKLYVIPGLLTKRLSEFAKLEDSY